jgi:hypothetical protein
MRSIESMTTTGRKKNPTAKKRTRRPVNSLGNESLERAYDDVFGGLALDKVDTEIPGDECNCDRELYLKELLRKTLAFWAHRDVCCMPPIDFFDLVVRVVGDE